MTQLTIFQAIEAGQQGMSRAARKASQADPFFAAKAEQAILSHLRANGPCSGEVLTDIARAHGARPQDDRAFGAVFRRLSKRGAIRTTGFCLRTKGNGTAGGRIWGIAKCPTVDVNGNLILPAADCGR